MTLDDYFMTIGSISFFVYIIIPFAAFLIFGLIFMGLAFMGVLMQDYL